MVSHTSFGVFGDEILKMRGVTRLFEDVAVGPLQSLAVNGDGDVLSPHVLDDLAVSLVGGIELGVGVTLPVGADLESGLRTPGHGP